MKPAYLKDDALLDDIRQARARLDSLHLWWLGQSGFLLCWQERFLLFDPYLSDSLTKKYAATDKPHVRMTERAIDPARLSFVSVVTSSHNHTDHLDPETLTPLFDANPQIQFVIPEANRASVVDRLNITAELPIGLTAGATKNVGGFRIHGVPAAHNTLETDEYGRHKFMGYVVEAGPWTIYHPGDTLRYDGMVEQLQNFTIDVALLPINGDRPERRVAGNLNGPEAALLAADLRAREVIPCHYDMFEFNTADPAEFVSACEGLGQKQCVLRVGERWTAQK